MSEQREGGRESGAGRRGPTAVVSQNPPVTALKGWIEKLVAHNGKVELRGVLILIIRELAGAGARGPASLRGLLYSGCGGREVVYQDRPLQAWVQDLKAKGSRGRAIQVLLLATEDRKLRAEEGVRAATSLKEARALLSGRLPDLAILDLNLPDGTGLEILRDLGARSGIEVVVVSADTGADGPSGPARTCFGPMVGASPAMQEVYDLIVRVAPTDATVILTGESGTGKELVAQALHSVSRRSRKPYFAVNCGAVSPSLIDSELFGHEQGSFTGANHLHKGHFERANGGTLFLDEITEMPMELQVKLLRVLENGNFMRVGGDQPVEIDVRVIAATNRRPEEAVAEGKLREDLLYRLKVFPIHLPPLRDRDDDLELLCEHFLGELNATEGARKRLTRAALDRVRAYHWPGNVRELKNALQRAFILAEDKLTTDCLPKELGGREGACSSTLQIKVGTPLAEAERRLILATYDQCQGNKMKTAEALGISLRTLYNRLECYWRRDETREETKALGPD